MESPPSPPGITYEQLEPNRLKHLDFIQSVIGRLAGNSFVIKGWAITVAAAIFGFALNSSNTLLVVAAVIPTVAFWVLDTYFLRTERLFRALYDEVRSKTTAWRRSSWARQARRSLAGTPTRAHCGSLQRA